MKKAIRIENAMTLPIIDDEIEVNGRKGIVIEVCYKTNGENWVLVELL